MVLGFRCGAGPDLLLARAWPGWPPCSALAPPWPPWSAATAGLSAITDIGGLFLTVLGGAMVPLALMPAWLRPVRSGVTRVLGAQLVGGAALAGNAPAAVTSAAILVIVAAILGVVLPGGSRGVGRTISAADIPATAST